MDVQERDVLAFNDWTGFARARSYKARSPGCRDFGYQVVGCFGQKRRL